MSLPVSDRYLANALHDGLQLGETVLRHRHVGDVILSTGRLVACDPYVSPDREPLNLSLPCGRFPVILTLAEKKLSQYLAFATVRFRASAPVRWEMATVGDQDPATLGPGELFGYPVDAGTGCFMDDATGKLLDRKMTEDELFAESMIMEMDANSVSGWAWLDKPFGDGNLIAFTAGYGDGFYASYVGYDAGGEVSAVVTDFSVAAEASN